MLKVENTQQQITDLVERFRKGDVSAFEQLYHNYAKAMFNTCLRICGSAQDAEDILQESFLAAFNALKKIQKTPNFGPWLKAIVVNRSIDFVRHKKQDLQLNENVHDVESESETTDTAEEPDYTVQEVVEALKMLPDGFRIIVCLYLFENLSHREIADKLGIVEGTSKSQYARAKKKLIAIINSKRQQHAR